MNDLFELNQAVFIEKEQIKTDSLKVAQIFGKRHDNVIRAIENLKCECDPDFYLLNFEEVIVKYQNGRGGIQEALAYNLTKDGFTLLVMGFTGKVALEFKVAYIKAFNNMAVLLHNQKYITQGIQLGSKVQIKSGSPEFTVNDFIHDNEGYLKSVEVVCWNKNRIHKEVLSINSIIPIQEFNSDILKNFWTIVLPQLETFNHSVQLNTIALNLKHLLREVKDLPTEKVLSELLLHSKKPYPQYVQHRYVVKSKQFEKAIRCWIFQYQTQVIQGLEGGAK
ncbi:Rha family transcriptional regulator [Acinetobacter bereziniae]|uniref:Rha family transcriptional regulator n=1 Tax=Acinetobacter bereziniae TaxID=106648 RepID=UPI000668E666|nr:Rha family transcriptional regulator [Acinetobacter bereziniae]MBJ8428618.1 Rha family transcriptional regulator [Acinetobacter bereziniae]MBJ8477637.1 Rha family transcriptional regulator [Acinetobacter bereziniae]